MRTIKHDPRIAKRWTKLTRQEWKVVELVADGHNHESIANQLDIKVSTVKRHLGNIFRKLEVSTTLEVACEFYKEFLKLVIADE